MPKKVLLLSNSTNYGEPYLGWCDSLIGSFVASDKQNIIFIPYAGVTLSYDEYTDKVNKALQSKDLQVHNLDNFEDKGAALKDASAIFVGGGNTFHLLKKLQDLSLVEPIRHLITSGIPYVGWSAGSNIACPTICTTNDMPIVEPRSFEAIGLVPFQLNPHFTTKVIAGHGGESRLMRLQEYLVANPKQRVACLPEASYIKLENSEFIYSGAEKMVWLSKDEKLEYEAGPVTKVLLK